MVLLRRLSDDEREQARAGALDYPIFMAVTRSIGHDKRGNVLYRRTETGEDVVVERIDTIAEIDPATGNEVLRQVITSERLVDDELPDVASSYLRWLGEQS